VAYRRAKAPARWNGAAANQVRGRDDLKKRLARAGHAGISAL